MIRNKKKSFIVLTNIINRLFLCGSLLLVDIVSAKAPAKSVDSGGAVNGEGIVEVLDASLILQNVAKWIT